MSTSNLVSERSLAKDSHTATEIIPLAEFESTHIQPNTTKKQIFLVAELNMNIALYVY
jgi:hypothetical protein